MKKKTYVTGSILMIIGLITMIYRIEIIQFFIGGKEMAFSMFSHDLELKIKLFNYGIFFESLILIVIGVGLQIQEIFKLNSK